MSATQKIIGGAALAVVGAVLWVPTGGASSFLIGSGIGLAPGGVARRLPGGPRP